MVAPRTFIVSNEIGSRLRIVILTVRSEVFIFTSTDKMVPWRIVPEGSVSIHLAGTRRHKGALWDWGGTILKLDCYRLVLAFHEKPRWMKRARSAPALDCLRGEKFFSLVLDEEEMCALEGSRKPGGGAYLTSFMMSGYLASLDQWCDGSVWGGWVWVELYIRCWYSI